MPLAPFFQRSAVAAAQVLEGYDEDAIRSRLDSVTVGVSADPSALESPEGRALLDLTVRLLARLYPTLSLPKSLNDVRGIAFAINPDIHIVDDVAPDHLVVIGDGEATSSSAVFAGCAGWDGAISSSQAVGIGGSNNPIGAGIAACLAAASVFRAVFTDRPLAEEPTQWLSGLDLAPRRSSSSPTELRPPILHAPAVLVGAGAIGNGTIWALSRSEVSGDLIVVDPESLELSNVQRYALTDPSDVGQLKVDIALRNLHGPLRAEAITETWQDFISERGSGWETVLVALDTARDRRAVQASLPRWIANAWTQPGDLGVSIHPWSEKGACLRCLYLPEGETPSEDKLVATALGLPRPDVQARIRQILWSNGNAPRDLLEEAASALDVPLEDLLAFEDRPLRELYVEGICGGTVVPLSRVGRPTQDVHVPLAHQSALAGVLLAGRLLARAMGVPIDETAVTRVDVMRPLAEYLTQPMQKDPRGICICQDPIYREAYQLKWAAS